MRRPTKRKIKVEVTTRGVFQISTTPAGDTERRKIARFIHLSAIGKRDDGVTFAQIQFRTIHRDCRSEFFAWSKLLPRDRHEIQNKLAELGYEWPEDQALTRAILEEVANARPKRQFSIVPAPGWYNSNSVFVIPGQVFAGGIKSRRPRTWSSPQRRWDRFEKSPPTVIVSGDRRQNRIPTTSATCG